MARRVVGREVGQMAERVVGAGLDGAIGQGGGDELVVQVVGVGNRLSLRPGLSAFDICYTNRTPLSSTDVHRGKCERP